MTEKRRKKRSKSTGWRADRWISEVISFI